MGWGAAPVAGETKGEAGATAGVDFDEAFAEAAFGAPGLGTGATLIVPVFAGFLAGAGCAATGAAGADAVRREVGGRVELPDVDADLLPRGGANETVLIMAQERLKAEHRFH